MTLKIKEKLKLSILIFHRTQIYEKYLEFREFINENSNVLKALGSTSELENNLGPKNGPKMKILKKLKKHLKAPPGIHLRNKCTKFQPNPTIFEVYRLPQSFGTKFA